MRKMKTSLFKKIIDELSDIGWQGGISLDFYGEPLLDDRMTTLVEYIRNKLNNTITQIYTNGDYLTLDLYKKLIKAGLKQLNITQHSEKVNPNITEIINFRQNHGADNVTLIYRRLEKLKNRGGYISIDVPMHQTTKCSVPSWKIGIHYDGSILFCCNDYTSSIKLGNVANEKLINIWKKPYYRQLRRQVKNGVFNLEICKKCKYTD
jgi:radical SAM protein with 4Fe4S-binding SPASM domain